MQSAKYPFSGSGEWTQFVKYSEVRLQRGRFPTRCVGNWQKFRVAQEKGPKMFQVVVREAASIFPRQPER